VAVLGIALAFVANALSPHGLKLTRNYFPADSLASHPPTHGTNLITTRTNSGSVSELLVEQLRQLGLRSADSNEVYRLFRDPPYEQG